MHPSEKVTKQLTVRGGVNPYGQPDRKISGFFFDDFPKDNSSTTCMSELSADRAVGQCLVLI